MPTRVKVASPWAAPTSIHFVSFAANALVLYVLIAILGSLALFVIGETPASEAADRIPEQQHRAD